MTDEPTLQITLLPSTRTEVRGSAGIGLVSITTDATGTITQVFVHDVGGEPEDDFDPEYDKHLTAQLRDRHDDK